MSEQIQGVYELTEKIRNHLERQFSFVWVQGEVTNLTKASSGHLYFSLKEKEAIINCVWFQHKYLNSNFNKMTGEVFEPDDPRLNMAQNLKNGQVIALAGKLSIYAARGSYQLIVEYAEALGIGQYYLQLEALKKKLQSEGLLELSRKRSIKQNPKNIALITAKSGAVIQDFLRIASHRGLSTKITFYPSLVQGEGAAEQIISLIEQINQINKHELIVIIRGGGSIHDLMTFNDEKLARTIANSKIAILTGIGHESDQSIAGLVSDKDAATPSHAAQLLWTERREFLQQLDEIELTIENNYLDNIEYKEEKLSNLERTLTLLSPLSKLIIKENERSLYQQTIKRAFKENIDKIQIKHEHLQLSLQVLIHKKLTFWESELELLESKLVNPYAPLEKGYSLVFDQDDKLVTSAQNVHINQEIKINFIDSQILSKVTRKK